jgi:hypothetical protein
MPSSTTHFVTVAIFSRLVVTRNAFLAANTSIHGTKKELPFLNRFQFI